MINIKLGELNRIIKVFNSISSPQLNVVLSYSLLKILRKLDEEGSFYGESIKSLQNKYGKRDDSGNLVVDDSGAIQFDDDKYEEFNNEVQELVDMEVTIDCPKIGLSQLANENVKLSPVELAIIEDFIEIDI